MRDGRHQIDFLKFQIEEITNAQIIDKNEYDQLIQERMILLNSEELKETSFSGFEILYNQDNSIIDILNSLKNKLIKSSEFDEKLSQTAEVIDSCAINLREAANDLRDYSDNLDTNPERLCQIEDRIEVLDKLKENMVKSFLMF